MTPEAWVALVIGLGTMVSTIIGGVWFLSWQLSKVVARFEVSEKLRGAEFTRLSQAVEKLEVSVASIAVERERLNGVEHRLIRLEQWYDELRRGIGQIKAPIDSRL